MSEIIWKQIKVNANAFEIMRGQHYIGIVCFSVRLNKWAAMWDTVPHDDDSHHFRYDNREDALAVLTR